MSLTNIKEILMLCIFLCSTQNIMLVCYGSQTTINGMIISRMINKWVDVISGIVRIQVFNSLTNTELHAIGNHFVEVGISAGEQFITEGMNDPTLYILIEGQLEVFTKDKNGKNTHIAYVNPVETIGEMGYFQGGIRTASVKATKQSELLRAPYLNLTHYFEHVPHVANAFLEVIQRRQENAK